VKIDSKICTKCKNNKNFGEFTKSKLGKYGLRAICKECRAKSSVEYNFIRKHKISAKSREYRKNNAERISSQRAQHTKKNKKRLSEYAQKYRLDNPGKVNARTAKRRATRNQATLKWLSKDQLKQIENFYIEAVKISKETGVPHEVDHIIPLQGKTVRGLHVPWNLQILLKTLNRRKSRKLIT